MLSIQSGSPLLFVRTEGLPKRKANGVTGLHPSSGKPQNRKSANGET
jgi:hypothetical protein